MTKASDKAVVSEVPFAAPVELTEPKGIQISFDEHQKVPQIKFSGNGNDWNIRDILHVKRLLTLEYKRYLRGFRVGVKKEETR